MNDYFVFLIALILFMLFCYFNFIGSLFLAFGITLGFFGKLGWVGVWMILEYVLFKKKGGK